MPDPTGHSVQHYRLLLVYEGAKAKKKQRDGFKAARRDQFNAKKLKTGAVTAKKKLLSVGAESENQRIRGKPG